LACHDARMFVRGKNLRQQRNRRNKVVVVDFGRGNNSLKQRNTQIRREKLRLPEASERLDASGGTQRRRGDAMLTKSFEWF
jgi:hypothetical protein